MSGEDDVIASAIVEELRTEERPVEETEAAPPAPEPAKPEPPKERDRTAAKFAALSRKERSAQAERQAARAERAEAEKVKAEAQEILRKAEGLRSGKPIAALRDLGRDPLQFLEDVAAEGKPDPMREMREELAALRAWRAEQETAAQEAKRQADEARQQQAQEAGLREYVADLRKNEAKYPNLCSFDDEEIRKVAVAFAKQNPRLSDEEINEKLEQEAKEYYDKLEQRRAKVLGVSARTPGGSPEAGSAERAQGDSPKTLTNDLAGERSGVAASSEWSREKARKELLRDLNAQGSDSG